MASGTYQVLLLGAVDARRNQLQTLLDERAVERGLQPTTLRCYTEDETDLVDLRSPRMAVFFGSPAHASDTALVTDLLEDSIVIAPLVSSTAQVHAEIPPQLRHINALEVSMGLERVVTLIFEAFRLLRRDRRLFISYRRVDAQPLAERLYDALDARGFDVFIDVRSVPPAVDFQSELWHRLSDSDVVVLIDTPGFRQSRWTTQELAKANATNIQILHLLWPGQEEDSDSSFSHFVRLGRKDFLGWIPFKGQWTRDATIERICETAEQLRARAIAARYRYLVDNFCDAARDLGLEADVQPEQWISLKVKNKGRDLAIVPAIGVPSSTRIDEIFKAAAHLVTDPRNIWIIYDNRGILNSWLAHLDWLDEHLPLRTVRMAHAPGLLRELTL